MSPVASCGRKILKDVRNSCVINLVAKVLNTCLELWEEVFLKSIFPSSVSDHCKVVSGLGLAFAMATALSLALSNIISKMSRIFFAAIGRSCLSRLSELKTLRFRSEILSCANFNS